MSPVLAYILGMLTLPVLAGLALAILWSFEKNNGVGHCLVGGCRLKPMEPGEHFNITVWLVRFWHRWLTGPEHRKRVIAYWQDRKDRGLFVNPYARKYLK